MLFMATLLLLLIGFQTAWWFAGYNVAQTAAQAAYTDSRAYQAPADAGKNTAEQLIANTRQTLRNPPESRSSAEQTPSRSPSPGTPSRSSPPESNPPASHLHDDRPDREVGAGTMIARIRRLLRGERGVSKTCPAGR